MANAQALEELLLLPREPHSLTDEPLGAGSILPTQWEMGGRAMAKSPDHHSHLFSAQHFDMML